MGGIDKVRSTFFCTSCKTGYTKFEQLEAKELHGVRHRYGELASNGFWSVALYCKKCDMPVYTRLKHLVREQQSAFRRHNAKIRRTHGKK